MNEIIIRPKPPYNIKTHWENYTFEQPQRLSQARVEKLRSCGLSGRKAEYIIGFSHVVARNEFNPESLKNCEHEEIIEKLTQIRGLGQWTAEMTIVTAINVENMSPAGDLGDRKAISRFYNHDELMSGEETRKYTEKWGVHKGIVTYYLIAEYLHGK